MGSVRQRVASAGDCSEEVGRKIEWTTVSLGSIIRRRQQRRSCPNRRLPAIVDRDRSTRAELTTRIRLGLTSYELSLFASLSSLASDLSRPSVAVGEHNYG